MLVRRSAKFQGNSRMKSCEESRRNGAAARPSGGSLENLDSVQDFICEGAGRENAPFRTDGSEAAPPHLGARCRSQLVSYAPIPGPLSGKSTCDTCAHRRAVASLRCWQEQAVVRERHPNAPPQTEPTRLERHRHHCFSRPYAGTETAIKCRDRRGTISLDWNNCVQCISKLRGACGGCTRSSLVQKKRAAHCMMHSVTQVRNAHCTQIAA